MINKISKKFNTFKELRESAINWKVQCFYQLGKKAPLGEHHAILLDGMQLSYSLREGAFAHEITAPRGCVSIAVVKKCRGKATFGQMKLLQNDIVVFDETRDYLYTSSDELHVATLSVARSIYETYFGEFKPENGFSLFIDEDGLGEILFSFLNENLDEKELQETVVKKVFVSLKNYTPHHRRLTRGEEIAFNIVSSLKAHMDMTLSMDMLAKKYEISKETLQNSFRSLFGMTPLLFLRTLKLNLVHNELLSADEKEVTVTRIAHKWGFTHMGRFTQYYKDLFGCLPSETLKQNYAQTVAVEPECVERKEEI